VSGAVIIRGGERLLALPLTGVVEVFRMVAIAAQLPRAPRHCLGVVDCRGRLVPVFDLAGRLGLAPARNEAALIDGHVVLIKDAVGEVGYAVDEVSELSENPPEALEAKGHEALGRITLGAVRTADGKLAPLIDPGALLTVLGRHQLRAALEALAHEESRT
jgi:purine-binding chemotaxis protein CheW